MSGLHFDVTGDNSNFLRKLEETKRGVSEAAKFMESQGKKMDSTLHSVSFGDTLKKQIYEGSQSVNGLTAQIIKQRAVIKDIEQDVRNLGEAYKRAGVGTPKGNALFADFKSAKSVLREEKAALFDLQTQQAQARLSVRKLKNEYSLYQKEGRNVVDSNNNMSLSFKKTLAAIGGVAALKQLGSAIIEARAEMQQLEKSFEVLLGSKAKSDVFVKEIKNYALISPLSTSDVSKAAQTLLGFGVASEKVIPTLKMLGDVSMGNSQRFSSLALAFAQVQAAGKLTGNDLLQLVNAGFNPLKNISEKTGKSMSDLKKEMSDGSISADMVADAFKSATEQGGQFHGMIEKNADGIRNAQNILQGSIQETLNKIGEQNEGLIKGGYEAATYLVENYREIGNCVTGLIGVYGTYRTALLINSVLELGSVKAVWAKITATKAATIAQATYNKVLMMNPYVMVGAALVSLGIAMWTFADNTSTAERAQKRFNERQEEAQKLEQEHKQKIDSLVESSRDSALSDLQRGQSLAELRKEYPKIFEQYDIETIKLADILKLKQQIAEEDAKRADERFAKDFESASKSVSDYETQLAAKQINGGKLTQQEINKLKELRTYRDEFLIDKGKGISEQFISNLKNLDISEFDRYISELEKKIKGKGNDGKVQMKLPIDIKGTLSDEAIYDVKDIKTLIDTAKSSKAGRIKAESEKTTYKEDYEKAKKDWEDAKKALIEIEKDKSNFTSKQYEDAKKRSETSEKAYKDLGGITGSSLTKQESAAEKLREQQEKLTEEMKKSIQERKELLIQSEMDIQQQQIDLKEEGAEKELAQIRLNYDRQYQEIAKRERELLEKLQAEERKQWEKDNPNYEKKGLKFTPKTTSLTPEQRVPFDKEYSLAFQKQEKDTQSLLERLLEKYRDFDAQRTAIEKDGNADIAALQAKRTNENAAEIDRAITVAKQKIKEGIQAVTDTEASKTAEDNPFLKNLFGDTSQMAFKDLQNLIEQAKQLQSYLSGNGDSSGITFITPEQLKTIAESPDELDKLKKALDKLLKGEKGNEWDDIFEGFTKGLAKVKSAKGFKEFSEGMQDIGDSASKASSMIGGVAGNLSSMFEEMGNTGAADAMSGVQDAMNAISNIGQGFAKGGIVGGIAAAVGEAANFIGKAFAANARHKAALKEIMNETIAQQREYNLLLMQQNLEYEKAATIFGTDVYGKAANAVRVMKDAVADLNEELKGSGTYSKGYSFSIKNGVVDDLTKAQRDLYNAYEGLANIEIKTGHKKTGLFGWGKGKDIYSSILSVYPELIKANGEFDASLAETILNTREMSDESKKSLQNMIDLANQAKEAYEAINDYFTDIFGELGNTMSDALVDAFRNGTDAAQAFTDSVSNMLETLAKQMIYSVTLAPIMEKAQKEMMDVMQNVGLSDEQKFSKWTGILDGLVDDAVNQQGLANRLLEEYQQTAKDKGYEIFSPDKSTSQNSTQKGFETMSQDTGTELNGRFTALQVSSEEIKNSMLSMLSGVNLISTSTTANGITLTEIKNLAMSSNNYLEDIAGFQKKIVNDFGRKLDSIDGGIKQFNGKH